MNPKVPHSGPLGAPLLIVGEAPGETEVEKLEPFVGICGNALREVIHLNGYDTSNVRFANICNFRPPDRNKFETLRPDQVEEGILELFQYIEKYPPKVILGMGNWPLHHMMGLAKFNNKKQIGGISNWRGSILEYAKIPLTHLDIIGQEPKIIKYIPSYHPSYLVRNPSIYPVFNFDVGRAISELSIEGLQRQARSFTIFPEGLKLIEWREKLLKSTFLTCDIESVKKSTKILCVGFATSPNEAVSLSWERLDQRAIIIEVLTNSNIKKCFHFGTFDNEMLYLNGVHVENYSDDTMALAQILNPELPRGLDFLCSTYTREPYYKGEGRANIPLDTKVWSETSNKKDLGIYNCKDVAVDFEIYEQQIAELREDPELLYVYEQEIEQIHLAHSISREGMPVDTELRDRMLLSLMSKINKLEFVLNGIYTYIMNDGKPYTINIRSNPQMHKALYTHLDLPTKRNREGNLTADDSAIVACITYCATEMAKVKKDSSKLKWKFKLDFVTIVRDLRELHKLASSYLANKLSADGMARTTFKACNTDTGRWAAEKYVDGTGLNGQTFPRASIEVEDNPVVPNKDELLAMFSSKDDEDDLEDVA